jgi:hypothetical protein
MAEARMMTLERKGNGRKDDRLTGKGAAKMTTLVLTGRSKDFKLETTRP